MSDKQLVLSILPGDDLHLREMVVSETGLLVDTKRHETVMLTGRPAMYRLGQRVVPWVRERSVVAFFSGDGESLDFKAGPENDWRQTPLEIEELPDEATPMMRARAWQWLVDRKYQQLKSTAGKRALMTVNDVTTTSQGSLSMLVTLTIVAVMIVFAMVLFTYVENRGGMGSMFQFSGDLILPTSAPQPTPTPGEVF